MTTQISFVLNGVKYLQELDFTIYLNIASKISKEIALILYDRKPYEVKSFVRPEIFEDFLNYLASGLNLECLKYSLYDVNNRFEYYLLYREFKLMSQFFTKEEEDNLLYLSCLKYTEQTNQLYDKSCYEQYIAEHLDIFIDKNKDLLESIDINSLYNIFYHEKRNLSDQTKAYYFITKAKNEDLCILLESLDEKELSLDAILDSFLKIKEHHGIFPKITSDSFFSQIQEQVKTIEQGKKELNKKLETENQKLHRQHEIEINQLNEINQNMQRQHEIEINQLNEINQNMQRQHEIEINQLKEENRSLKKENQKIEKIIKSYESEIECLKKQESLKIIQLQKTEQLNTEFRLNAEVQRFEDEKKKIQTKYEEIINNLKNEIKTLKEPKKDSQENDDQQNTQVNEVNEQQIVSFRDFNNSSLRKQKDFISDIVNNQSFISILKTISNPIISNLNNLLKYLNDHNKQENHAHYFNILTNDLDQPFKNLTDNSTCIIVLLSYATEKLFIEKQLNLDLVNLLNNFNVFVSFEIQYPSNSFDDIYQSILKIKKSDIEKFRITIVINGTRESTDLFKNNNDIDYLIIKKVETISSKAFYKCTSLIQVSFANYVKIIGDYSFNGCSSLKFITLPDTVTSIENNSFEECSSLKKFTIPNNVNYIGVSAFKSCSNLLSITIPSSVTSIEDSSFEKCTSLKEVLIHDKVKAIGSNAFSECSSLKQIDIKDSVALIGERCFYKCTSLTYVHIPKSLTSIEESTFEKCISLNNVKIPESVKSIHEKAFYGCDKLEKVDLHL